MTSERNKRVEEEGEHERTGKRGRENKRVAGTAVPEKGWRAVEKMAASGRAAEGNERGRCPGVSWNPKRLTSQNQNPANPFNPKPPGKEEKLSHVQMAVRAHS